MMVSCIFFHERSSMTLEGTKAPDFSLQGSDGTDHSLARYAGKGIVLFFYPKDNTSGCTKEACAFSELSTQFAELGFTVLGVSKDSLASHGRFIQNHGLTTILLSDPDTTMMQAYQAFGEKVMYGKAVQGTIRSTVVIMPDGTIGRHWPKVAKAETHPQAVLDYLSSLKRP